MTFVNIQLAFGDANENCGDSNEVKGSTAARAGLGKCRGVCDPLCTWLKLYDHHTAQQTRRRFRARLRLSVRRHYTRGDFARCSVAEVFGC
jgi:hypothetical protein